MILRIDRWGTELPPPSDPDPQGAKAVQELMGGRFGEMSTLMNYTMQSFNFRGREKARPFYDLIANIAAEELSHIETVSYAINLLLTGATKRGAGGLPACTSSPQVRDAAARRVRRRVLRAAPCRRQRLRAAGVVGATRLVS